MRKLIAIISLALTAVSMAAQGVIPSGETYVRQLQQRDSILIADQLEYGFVLEGIEPGDSFGFPECTPEMFGQGMEIVRTWALDTLAYSGKKKDPSRHVTSVRASVVVSPFEEGTWQLPPLAVQRVRNEIADTLIFDPQVIEVCTIPIDTATFVIHDIKDQVKYPLTAEEVMPYVFAVQILAVLAILIVSLIKTRRRKEVESAHKEPAYIVALRGLDRFRGDRYWAPDKQKAMYSGITDTLRTYIESRFDVNAEEMTTAEIFDALKSCGDIPSDIYGEMKELFELSDFVKFAKHVASDEENARAIPAAVRFVTSTYQSQLDAEAAAEEGAN